jgi:hypothetical protein
MRNWLRHCVVILVAGMAGLAAVNSARAHFIWLKTDDIGGQIQAVLFFGEDAADEAYHLPERLTETKVWCRTADGQRTELATESVETDDRIGLVAPLSAEPPCALEATQEYGVYHGSLLTYYAKHVHATSNEQLSAVGLSPELKLDVVPRAVGDTLELTVLWNGRPQAEASVTLVREGESEEFTTDADGKVTFKSPNNGLVAVRTNVTDKAAGGTVDGEEYTGGMHFATLTLQWRKAASAKPQAATTRQQSALAPLPEAVSSFGGAVCDGWLYVYSGHIGTEHEHSAANLSRHFRRLWIDGSGEWEELPMETPLQGLALVAHGGKLYRVGGLAARNATADDEADLHSTAEFACFDPATNDWTALAPLPDPRSSHDAVVIGERLYVVGGWTLAGERNGQWLDDSLVFEFGNPGAGWQQLPAQSFRRRAVAAGHWQGKLAVLGGMDDQHDISQRVELFDPTLGEWSAGPELPGAGMAGFGLSAWDLDGRLYACGLRGRLYRLAGDGSEWEQVTRLATGRFFHRLLPGGSDSLLVVGGASRKGHVAHIERIDLSPDGEAGRTTRLDAGRFRSAASDASP